MKISFWITAVVLFCTVRFVFPNNLQVGTVLFTTTDIVKKCWTESDKALLRARLIMQESRTFEVAAVFMNGCGYVLPEPDCINFSKPGVVAILLDYFESCYEIISSSTYGKAQNLMFLALSDAVGGYLRAYILPISKRAYYAGQVEYSETSKLFQLYNDIKMFLKTNGMGWAKPYKLSPLQMIPKPLVISSTGAHMACNSLYIIEKNKKFRFNGPQKIKNNLFVKSPERFRNKAQQTSPRPELHPLSGDEEPTFKELQQLQSILLPNTTNKTTTEIPFKNCKQWTVETTTNSTVTSEPHLTNKNELKRIFRNESATEKIPRKRLQRQHDLSNIEKSSSCRIERQSGDSEENSPFSKEENPLMGCLMTFPDDVEEHNRKVIIPLPVLDDSVTPFTLAVPFKFQPLRSIRGRSSAFVLEHYYVSVIKCMISKGSSKGDIKQFNGHFFSWLCSEVYPHLGDEVWYPAFGGVLRITETIKKLGADSSLKEPIFNDLGYMFPKKFEFDDSPQKSGKEKTRDVGDVKYDGEHTQSKRFVTYGIIISAVASLFVFWACIFCVNSLKIAKSHRSQVTISYDRKKNPKHDGSCSGREQFSEKKVCYDGVLMTKAEKKCLKKAEKKAKRERAKHFQRERKKLKRVPDWKEVADVQKGGGDRLPLIKLPWTFVRKKKQERGDSTDEENPSKCLVHDSSVPSWPSQSPFITLQKLDSRFNTFTTEATTPFSTDMNQDSKALRNPLDKIKLIWKKPSNKSTETYDDKDTEQLGKTSFDSTFESSKKEKELLGTLPSDSYTFSVEDERRRHHMKKRCNPHDRSETCLIPSRTTSPFSETPETSSVESETDESYSSESDSSRQTTNYK